MAMTSSAPQHASKSVPPRGNELFRTAEEDMRRWELDLRYKLPGPVVEEIIALANLRTNEKFDQIIGVLSERYDQLKRLYEKFAAVKDQNEYRECLKRFFELVHPRDVLTELKAVLTFPEIRTNYELFIEQCASRPYGEVFARYRWNEEVYVRLEAGILTHSKRLMEPLEKHARQIADHVDLLEDMKDSAVGKGIIKIGSRVAGSLLAGPIGSLAARGLTSLFMEDDREKIPASLERVEAQWNAFSDTLDEFIRETRVIYRYVLLTLYGGTLLKVQEDLHARQLRITDINLLDHDFLLELTEEETQRVLDWAESSGRKIEQAIMGKQSDAALSASQIFYQTVSSSSVHSGVLVQENRSLLYQANLYKAAAICLKASEFAAQDPQRFAGLLQQYYLQAPMLVNDKDMEPWLSETLLPLSLKYIHISLSAKKDDALLAMADYFERMFERTGKQLMWTGEQVSGEMDTVVLLLNRMLFKNKPSQRPLAEAMREELPNPEALKQLASRYTALSKGDAFARELRNGKMELIGFRIGSVLFAPMRWVIGHWKLTMAAAILGVGIYGYAAGWWQALLPDSTAPKTEERAVQDVPDKAWPTSSVTVMAEQANVRLGPGTDYEVVEVVNKGDSLVFLQETLMSEGGVEWLNVELPDGRTGWISGKIVDPS